MRAFWIAVAVISTSLIFFICLPVAHALTGSGGFYREWILLLGLALLVTFVVVSIFWLVPSRDGRQKH